MSARIGEIKLVEDVVTHVSASRAGVEVLTEARLTYDPINARNYAALLVRAADEAERMRKHHVEPDFGDPHTTDYCVTCGESPDSGSHLPSGHLYVDPRPRAWRRAMGYEA